MNLSDLWLLIVQAVSDAWNLEWDQLSYKKSSLVIKAAMFIVAVFFTHLMIKWRRWRKQRPNSYYYTSFDVDKRHEPSIFFRLIRGLTWCLVLASLCFLAITLADPVVFIANTTEMIESREIVYDKDVSASNGFRLSKGNISRGELAQETLEKLIIKRKDKKDRAAYIIFGTDSEIWSGFTTDFESLMFLVSISPIAFAPTRAPTMWPDMFILKKDQYTVNEVGYGTSLHLGLESAIYLFDRKGSPKITEELEQNPNAKMRSVVIITDGAADVDPEPQFRELQKRRITPYLIFIDPDRTIEKQIYGENHVKAQLPDQLLTMVQRSGGQYFMAWDQKSVDRISETLDRLHGVRQVKKTKVNEREVYFITLAISFLFAIIAMLLRFISMLVWRRV